MNITDITSDDYVAFPPETPVSKLAGVFTNPSLKAVVVHGDDYDGIVTRRQLATSHHHPDEQIGSLIHHVPRLTPDEDIRTAAGYFVASDAPILPVFTDGGLEGIVTIDSVLTKVQPFLDTVRVRDVSTDDLVTVRPGATFGTVLNHFREHRITHLPVVEDHRAVGILSLYDVTHLTVRSIHRSQGGNPAGVDPAGGEITDSAARARRGGYGAREGELARILDLPVRDLMTSPVRTIDPDATLDAAVAAMFDINGSALVVVTEGRPTGIVTKTDILEALTWDAPGHRPVQVYGADLLDDLTYDEVVAMIDRFDEFDASMRVFDAKIHLHEHDETLRGVSLLLARIRLYTDGGVYLASGVGYGARHAINEARHVLERQIRDQKTYGRTKKPRSAEFWEKRFGWLLEPHP